MKGIPVDKETAAFIRREEPERMIYNANENKITAVNLDNYSDGTFYVKPKAYKAAIAQMFKNIEEIERLKGEVEKVKADFQLDADLYSKQHPVSNYSIYTPNGALSIKNTETLSITDIDELKRILGVDSQRITTKPATYDIASNIKDNIASLLSNTYCTTLPKDYLMTICVSEDKYNALLPKLRKTIAGNTSVFFRFFNLDAKEDAEQYAFEYDACLKYQQILNIASILQFEDLEAFKNAISKCVIVDRKQVVTTLSVD